MRLIDADALMDDVMENGVLKSDKYGIVLDFGAVAAINNAPTIDAEPVVRCKDCMYRGKELVCPMCRAVHTWNEDDGSDWYVVDNTADNGYCHMGEKMDGGEE